MNTIAYLSPGVDLAVALSSLVGAVATFAVMRWRIGDLDRRVEMLERAERISSGRVVVIETKLENIEQMLRRIEEKLEAIR